MRENERSDAHSQPPQMTERPIQDIRSHLLASRARVLALARDLDPQQLALSRAEGVDPPLWMLGHIAWFQERWCLRHQDGAVLGDSLLRDADQHYDPSNHSPGAPTGLTRANIDSVRTYLDMVLERTLARLEAAGDQPRVRNFIELAAHHEDVVAEALHAARQALGYGAPLLASRAPEVRPAASDCAGDVCLPGGSFMLGAYPHHGFAFDNEKWAHETPVTPLRIARAPVTVAEFRAFIEAGGYQRRGYWSAEGWAWVRSSRTLASRYWRMFDGVWMERRFDRLVPVQPELPVTHVNWFEAEAYCNFAGRRLPTEAEWEYAATHSLSGAEKTRYPWGEAPPTAERADLESSEVAPVAAFAGGDTAGGCRQMIGNVWEWTANTFEPYPGFAADAGKGFSAGHFGSRKVLRGGSFATPWRLVRTTRRAFHLPERSDMFAGFRTCAIEQA